MKTKTISTYIIGAVAGVGLTIGSVAFAVNNVHGDEHHNGGTMGNTTQQATPTGMHGQTAQKTYGGMMGNTTQHATQNGMHGNTPQIAPDGMHNGMATGTDHQNAPCHATTGNQDKKS